MVAGLSTHLQTDRSGGCGSLKRYQRYQRVRRHLKKISAGVMRGLAILLGCEYHPHLQGHSLQMHGC